MICVLLKEKMAKYYVKINIIINIKNIYLETKLTPEPYNHWLLKEIEEQPKALLRSIGNGGRLFKDKVILGGLNNFKNDLINLDNIILLGCGTSLNSAQIARYFFKELTHFNSIQVFDGAEFDINDIPKKEQLV